MVLDVPGFIEATANITVPVETKIVGGHSKTSTSMNVAPNRERKMNYNYHYYWSDENGFRAKESDLNVTVSATYHEKTNEAPILKVLYGDSKISQQAAEFVQSELQSHGLKVKLVDQPEQK